MAYLQKGKEARPDLLFCYPVTQRFHFDSCTAEYTDSSDHAFPKTMT